MSMRALEERAINRNLLAKQARKAVDQVGDDWVQARFMQDIIGDATAVFWLHRARAFEHLQPRPDDPLAEIAAACRNAARRALRQHLEPAEVLAEADAELRAALDAGDVVRIHLAAGLVDWLTAPAWRPPAYDEPTDVLIARHRRIIAAVDAHLAAARREAA